MATNKELREEAAKLWAELGLEPVDTDRMGNPALVDLVEGLRAKLTPPADGAADGAADGSQGGPPPPAPPAPPVVDGAADGSQGGPPPPAPPAPPVVAHPYQVADGKALTGPRGVLGPGAEVLPSDHAQGEAGIERLVALGYVTKR